MNAFPRHPRTSEPPPFFGLDANQRLLVSAMRHWTETPAIMPGVVEPLFRLFGIYHIEAALEAFELLMQVATDPPSRPAVFHPCNSSRVSRDEMAILSLISAFQASELSVAHAIARGITAAENAPDLLAAASVLAEALDARRIVLRLRDDRPLALMAVVGRG